MRFAESTLRINKQKLEQGDNRGDYPNILNRGCESSQKFANSHPILSLMALMIVDFNLQLDWSKVRPCFARKYCLMAKRT
jgi:hypothetical protein